MSSCCTYHTRTHCGPAASQADARGVASWLVSSNVGNRGFYGALGFEVVRTFYMGAENPTWKQKPVPVDVVSGQSVLRCGCG